MSDQVIVVTGAAGFLGSAITVDLAREHTVVAIDRRAPTKGLVNAARGVTWKHASINDTEALDEVFHGARQRSGHIDLVIHLAAFYHFGSGWRREYEQTNVDGTSNVLEVACQYRARRFLFASSIAAMAPSPDGQSLSERTPTAEFIPYAKSKSMGEKIVRTNSDRLPAIVLRIAGVFTDWCELPPLYSLLKVWRGHFPLNRVMVGRGFSGIPFIHRHDLVRCVRACVAKHGDMASHEVLLASSHGSVSHRELFDAIQRIRGKPTRPIFLPAMIARLPVGLRIAWGHVTGNLPYERPWMLKYVDRPWTVDTTYTHHKLHWHCTPGLSICDRLPLIVERFDRNRAEWERRNRLRNEAQYVYAPD